MGAESTETLVNFLKAPYGAPVLAMHADSKPAGLFAIPLALSV